MFSLATPSDFAPYPWMEFAFQEYGQKEIKGTSDNPRIKEYLKVVGVGVYGHDETAWCSAFANWCMAQANIKGSGRANARSWLTWQGKLARGPVYGCVVVLSRPPQSWQGHVAFWVGENQSNPMLLGGNQGDTVSLRRYPRSRVLDYRGRPKRDPRSTSPRRTPR
jgi:uncharacterized protein (TIGR02594 family)